MIKFEDFRAVITSKTARQVFLAKKHSPQALFIAGTVGVIGATVLACRATLKLDTVLDEAENHENNLKTKFNKGQSGSSQTVFTEESLKKSLTLSKAKTGLEIAKLYAPAVGLGLVSVAALTGSHVILNKRNSTALAAFAGLDRAYREYRDRVADEYGKDVDRKFASGAETVLVEEKLADGKTKTTTTTSVKKDGKYAASPYSVLFDETSKRFSREPGMNAMMLGVQQTHANNKLRSQGHLFLNEVFDMLGFPRTAAGALCGWIYRHDHEEKNGDNYVDFGIFSGDIDGGEAFVEGRERSVWLDFNVDGEIVDKI